MSFSVHTTARVLLRWFWLRVIGFSVHTTAMANSDGPTAMVFVKGNWLFCADNCDGQLRCFDQVDLSFSVLTTAMANCDGFLEEANSISLDNSISFDDIS